MAVSDIFDFPYHTPNDEYPGSSSLKLGRGYRFAAKPPGPDEVLVHLNFPSMFVWQLNAGDGPNKTVFPQLNIYALETFYKKVRMYEPFTYPHATKGNVIVRFTKPLIMPKTIKTSPGEIGGMTVAGTSYRLHQVEPFDLELMYLDA